MLHGWRGQPAILALGKQRQAIRGSSDLIDQLNGELQVQVRGPASMYKMESDQERCLMSAFATHTQTHIHMPVKKIPWVNENDLEEENISTATAILMGVYLTGLKIFGHCLLVNNI